jgi:hypothetical protein
MTQDHWLPGFNYNVEKWDATGQHYETLAICRQLAYARAVFKEAVVEKPGGKFMIRARTRVVKGHPRRGRSCGSHLCKLTLREAGAKRIAAQIRPRLLVCCTRR